MLKISDTFFFQREPAACLFGILMRAHRFMANHERYRIPENGILCRNANLNYSNPTFICVQERLCTKDRMMNMITFWNPSTWFCNMTRHFCAKSIYDASRIFFPPSTLLTQGKVLPLFFPKAEMQ